MNEAWCLARYTCVHVAYCECCEGWSYTLHEVMLMQILMSVETLSQTAAVVMQPVPTLLAVTHANATLDIQEMV